MMKLLFVVLFAKTLHILGEINFLSVPGRLSKNLSEDLVESKPGKGLGGK